MPQLFTKSDLRSTPKVRNGGYIISGMGRPRSRQPGQHWDFGLRFKEACKDARISDVAKDRAAVFGVNTTTIGNWEHGDKLPGMDNAIGIATKTGVSVDWLLTGRGEKRARTAASEELDISHLPRESQAAIRALVHSLEHQGDSAEEESG